LVVHVRLVVALLAVFLVLGGVVAGAAWVAVGEPVYPFATADIDGDGAPELVTPAYVWDGGALVNTTEMLVVAKADVDGDGLNEIVTYAPVSGVVTLYNPPLIDEYTVDPGAEEVVATSRSVRVGGVVVTGAGAMDWGVAGAVSGDDYVLADINSTGLYLYLSWRGSIVHVYPAINASIVDVALFDRTVVVLLDVVNGSAVYVYDDVTGSGRLTIYPGAEPRAGYIASPDVVYVFSDDVLYRLAGGRVTPVFGYEAFFYPAGAGAGDAVLYTGHRLIAVRLGAESVAVLATVDYRSTPLWADYDGFKFFVASGTGIEMYIRDPAPAVSVAVPPVVYVGEDIIVVVSGNYTTATVSGPGATYTITETNTTLKFKANIPGKYEIVAVACTVPGACTRVAVPVTVAPRPLEILVEAPENVTPYQPFTVNVEAYDAITMELADNVLCTAEVEGYGIVGTTVPGPITLPAVPTGTSVVVHLTCRGPTYQETTKTLALALSEPYLDADLDYLGAGKFRIHVYNKFTGQPYTGEIYYYVNGLGPQIPTPDLTFTLQPGEYNITIEAVFNNVPIYRETIPVRYYETIFEVPAGERVIVGDRIIEVVKNQTVTVTVTKTQVEVKEIPTLSPGLAVALLFAGALIAGLTAIVYMRRAGARKPPALLPAPEGET